MLQEVVSSNPRLEKERREWSWEKTDVARGCEFESKTGEREWFWEKTDVQEVVSLNPRLDAGLTYFHINWLNFL